MTVSLALPQPALASVAPAGLNRVRSPVWAGMATCGQGLRTAEMPPVSSTSPV